MQPCDRTVAQFFLEIAHDLGFERKNAQFVTVLPFFGPFCNFWGVFLLILFPQKFLTEILVAQKNLLLEILVGRVLPRGLQCLVILCLRI